MIAIKIELDGEQKNFKIKKQMANKETNLRNKRCLLSDLWPWSMTVPNVLMASCTDCNLWPSNENTGTNCFSCASGSSTGWGCFSKAASVASKSELVASRLALSNDWLASKHLGRYFLYLFGIDIYVLAALRGQLPCFFVTVPTHVPKFPPLQ